MSKNISPIPEGQTADCLACKHFRVTWDADHPRGCVVMGFKSRTLPSHEVRSASGLACLKFDPKPIAPSATQSAQEKSVSPAGSATKRHWVA
ncbi:MAG: hypothetical protein H7833_16850 [Magnetococcus sp. DMHC-1]